MRRFFNVTFRYSDSVVAFIADRSRLLSLLQEARDAINRTSPDFTVADAMRTIMDEQTFEWSAHTFKVAIEIIPSHFTVKSRIGLWENKEYYIV